MNGNFFDWGALIGIVAAVALMWKWSRDFRDELRDELRDVRKDVTTLSDRLATLSGRLARIEGWIEGRFRDSIEQS